MSGLGGVASALGIADKLLGITEWFKQLVHDAQVKQTGIEEQQNADLKAEVKVARDQAVAEAGAPKTEAETIDAMRKGGF